MTEEFERRLVATWANDPTEAERARTRAAALGAFRAARRRRVLRRRSVAAVCAVLVAVPAGLWEPTTDALPGDLLYGVKTTAEGARVWLASGPAEEAETYLALAGARSQEIERARREGRTTVTADLVERYVASVQRYRDRLAAAGPGTTQLRARGEAELAAHRAVLTHLLTEVPDPARPGLRRAIEVSSARPERVPDQPPAGPGEPSAPGPPQRPGPPPGVPIPPRGGPPG